jgi:hypothetical protein
MRFIRGKRDKGFKGRLKRMLHRASFAAISIVAAAPLFFSPVALAAPNTTYTPRDFSSLALTDDRSTPSGGFAITPDLLTLNVDNTKANTSAHFYQTEGLQATLPHSNSIRAKLYVDSVWQNKPTQAGLWGIAGNTTDSTQIGWPILQFVSNTDNFTGFRIYNTFTGNWSKTTTFDSGKDWNKWYTMEINYNPKNNNIEFYVNNSKVGSYSATEGTDTLNGIHGVIFNNFNTARNDQSENYTVQWQNFETGLATKGDKDVCLNGGFTAMTDENNQPFKNQGDCVSYMNGRPENGSNQPVTVQTLKF